MHKQDVTVCRKEGDGMPGGAAHRVRVVENDNELRGGAACYMNAG